MVDSFAKTKHKFGKNNFSTKNSIYESELPNERYGDYQKTPNARDKQSSQRIIDPVADFMKGASTPQLLSTESLQSLHYSEVTPQVRPVVKPITMKSTKQAIISSQENH